MSKENAFCQVLPLNDNPVGLTQSRIDLQNPNKEWRAYRIANNTANKCRIKFVNVADSDVTTSTGMTFGANASESFSSQATHLSVIAETIVTSLNITSGTGV
jgi:hypothetical protein